MKRSSAFHFRTVPGKFPTSPGGAKIRPSTRPTLAPDRLPELSVLTGVLCAGAERYRDWTECRRRGATRLFGDGRGGGDTEATSEPEGSTGHHRGEHRRHSHQEHHGQSHHHTVCQPHAQLHLEGSEHGA
ncbi:hypothetical protein GH733_010154 [Mirounga leonina]|nr:hypothetical protein GH733_010154 [Mirounga leonina]